MAAANAGPRLANAWGRGLASGKFT